MTIQPGEIHALLGQNGSGKSTLMKIAFGEVQPDSGEILIDGTPHTFQTPRASLAAGVAMVPQETPSALDLSVAENIFLGMLGTGFGRINWRQIYQRAEKLLDELGVQINVTRTVRSLAPHDRQLVAIAHALAVKSRFLIFDEPTSSLSIIETQKLFEVMRRLRNQGVGLVFITQRLREVAEVADRITILRDGIKVGERASIKQEDEDDIVRLVTGAGTIASQSTKAASDKAPLLKVSSLSDGKALQDVSLEVRAGEIVGISGLLGSGRTELLRALFGAADRPCRGQVTLNNKSLSLSDPYEAVRDGVALVTADRRHEGLLLDQSIYENILMVRRRHLSLKKIDFDSDFRLVQRLVTELRIKANSLDARVRTLSGGNQQKVVLGKWLASNPQLLLLDEPTRGIDVGARSDFYKAVIALAAQGAGVLVGSLDDAELLEVCHRIVVIRQGKIVANFDAAETTANELLFHASGLKAA